MKLQQPGDPEDYGPPPVAEASGTQPNPCVASDTPRVPVNNGQCQNVKESPQFPQNLHFAPNYPVAMTAIPIQPRSSTNATRPKSSKSARPPLCHHARYVLEEKPPRTSNANMNMECSNCGTKNTSAWRRSAEGKSECNACNLFFQKNGRKRPASMRRDTIARRYRLSRCDLCAMEAQGGQANFAQFQKTVARQRRNGKTAKTTPRLPAAPPTAPPNQPALGQQPFFVAHPEFPQTFSTFIAPNVEYNHQGPVMMSYAADRSMFNVMNVEHPIGISNEGQLCFATRPAPANEVFGQHLLTPVASVPQVEVIPQNRMEEQMVAPVEELAPLEPKPYVHFGKRPHEYDDFPAEQKMVKTEPVSHFDKQYSESLAKEKTNKESYMAETEPAPPGGDGKMSENRSEIATALNMYEEHPKEDGSGPVFRSL
ncbi:hypothetical protein Q1695_015290 [Nippostrongylus brasiliensis]|nr:hypothetical protein Q1695_015290 [Nippostrongylus brasiliensis]